MTQRRILWLILVLALLLRLAYALSQPGYGAIRNAGGDSAWYLANGVGFFSGQVAGTVRGINYDISVLPTAPLYVLFVGFMQGLFPLEAAIIAIRALQCLLATLICWLAYRTGTRLADDGRVGLLAAAALALHPAFIIDPANILAETLYIFWVCLGLWLYVEFAIHRPRLWVMLLVGAVLGLGTLTRAVLLLFPLGLLLHWLLVYRRRKLGLILALLLGYVLVVSSWTLYNVAAHERFVLASDQLTAAFWRGAVTTDGSPEENDAQLAGSSYEEQALQAVTSDLVGFVRLRITELTGAVLQPYNSVPLGDESLRALALHWLQDDFSLAGFGRLINAEGFWPKLILYVFHYVGLLCGLAGMLLARRQWRVGLVYSGFIAYTLLLHLVLLALPRYIFPTQVFLWLFAAYALAHIRDKLALMPQISE